MPYQRFTKLIISHFISKDKTISMRNRINLHTIRDDSLLGTLKFFSKTEDSHKYDALIPDGMINQDIKDSKAYKTYYDFATGEVALKKARKFKKITSPLRNLSLVNESEHVKKAKRVKRPAKKSTAMPTSGFVIRDTPALLEDAQLKKALKKSNKDESDDDNDDDKANDDDNRNEDDDGNDAHDSKRTDSYDDDENPSFTLKDYCKEEHDEEYESNDYNENVYEEEDDDLYKGVDMTSLGAEQEKERKSDEEMTDVDQNVPQEMSYEQVVEDAHVTLTSS
nr:hypothetical protein [Tanacetum cinerariifolium]